jgi:hypothetical protein
MANVQIAGLDYPPNISGSKRGRKSKPKVAKGASLEIRLFLTGEGTEGHPVPRLEP